MLFNVFIGFTKIPAQPYNLTDYNMQNRNICNQILCVKMYLFGSSVTLERIQVNIPFLLVLFGDGCSEIDIHYIIFCEITCPYFFSC